MFQTMPEAGEWAVSMSAVYVQQETVRDILDTSERYLRVTDARTRRVYVNGAAPAYVPTVESALDLLHVCWSQRMEMQTDWFGHTVVTVTARRVVHDGSVLVSRLTFVELGGSELACAGASGGGSGLDAKLSRINRGMSSLQAIVNNATERVASLELQKSPITFLLRDMLVSFLAMQQPD